MNVLSEIVHRNGGVRVVEVERTGRGPAGNVRNFAAMKTEKLQKVAEAIVAEANDPIAMRAVVAALSARCAS